MKITSLIDNCCASGKGAASAAALLSFDCHFWTMHCTGEDYFHKLRDIMDDRIDYLYCGQTIDI